MKTEEYLQSHSIKRSFAETMGWFVDDSNEQIIIQIFDEYGTPLYKRTRFLSEGSSEKFKTDQGATLALYCAHKTKDCNEVVLCEGEPDCVRLWQENIPSVCGTAGVRTINEKLISPLKGKKVIIVLDTDKEGVESVEKYYNLLIRIGAKPYIKDIPPEYKDISEYFTAGYTKDDFLALPELDLDDWLIKHEPEEFKWESAADILHKELPEEKWLINRAVPMEGFTFLIGPEASSKSYQALSFAKCVVTGEPWLPQKLDKDGRPLFRVIKRTKVLIMDKESTIRRIQDRLRGFDIKSEDIKFLAYPHKFEVAETTKDKATESGYTAFFESVARRVKKYGIGLVILDSFTDFFIGEENDRGDIQKFFDAFRQMFPGVAIVGLHHSSKMQPGQRKPTSQLGRGSTNIMAQTYTAFHFEPVRKSKTEFTVEQTKAGDSLKIDKFKIESQVIDDPLNEGETLVRGFLYIGDFEIGEEKLDEAIELLVEQLTDSGRIPQKELKGALVDPGTISEATFRRALEKMEEAGQIEKVSSLTVKNGKDIVWKGE